MHFQKKFTNAEKVWLTRQGKDQFVKHAKQEGYRARSAYKLLAIEKKFSLLKKSKKIVDLGSAPGSWSQVAREKSKAKIFAFDLLDMQTIAGVEFLQRDCFDLKNDILEITGGNVDLILSDMAPSSCGHSGTDHLVIVEMCAQCLRFCQKILIRNGNFVCKITNGSETQDFMNLCKTMFNKVNFFKPLASRQESREIYIVAQRFCQV